MYRNALRNVRRIIFSSRGFSTGMNVASTPPGRQPLARLLEELLVSSTTAPALQTGGGRSTVIRS